jgi:hypothetical protein
MKQRLIFISNTESITMQIVRIYVQNDARRNFFIFDNGRYPGPGWAKHKATDVKSIYSGLLIQPNRAGCRRPDSWSRGQVKGPQLLKARAFPQVYLVE